MNTKFIGIVAILCLAGILAVSAVSAITVTVDKVQVDDTDVVTGTTNTLAVDRNSDVDVEVKLTATADVKNMEVTAFVSGYEYNDVEPISKTTPLFDAEANVTYVKHVSLKFPNNVEGDRYLLRVLVTNRNDVEVIQNFQLKIDLPRHGMQIKDVLFNPETVKSGSALLTTVRLRNQGERDEEDVKVTVSIPQLGLSGTDYIDEIKKDDDEKETEEIYLRIPKCAKPGLYDANIEVKFDDNHKEQSATRTIRVAEDDSCAADQKATPKGSTTITLGSTLESVEAGSSVIFPLTLQNTGSASRSYTLTVSPVEDWATVKVTPSTTVVVEPGQSKNLYLFIAPKKDAALGPKVFTATISSNNEQLQQVSITANVTKGERKFSLAGALEVGLVVLIVILVVLALIVAFSRMKDDKNGKYY